MDERKSWGLNRIIRLFGIDAVKNQPSISSTRPEAETAPAEERDTNTSQSISLTRPEAETAPTKKHTTNTPPFSEYTHREPAPSPGGEQTLRRRFLSALPELAAVLGILALAGGWAWSYCFMTPCRVEIDCRGRGIRVEEVITWGNQESAGYNGIQDIAAWRLETSQTVTSVSTGRRAAASIAAVCGNAGLAYPAKILSGSCSLAGAYDPGGTMRPDGFCIITAELSDALFGSSETAGELVRTGEELLSVAGVIDRKGKLLLHAAAEGQIEYAAFRMSSRYQAESRARQQVGE